MPHVNVQINVDLRSVKVGRSRRRCQSPVCRDLRAGLTQAVHRISRPYEQYKVGPRLGFAVHIVCWRSIWVERATKP